MAGFKILLRIAPKHRIWGVTAFLALASVLLFIDRSGQTLWPRSLQQAWNYGHVVYFFALVALMRRVGILASLAPIAQWSAYLIGSFVVGVAIEIAQMNPRVPIDWVDVARDLAGALVGLLLTVKERGGARWRVQRGLAALVALIFLIPVAVALVDETIARVRFPVIADFETPFELKRWYSALPMKVVRGDTTAQGNHVLSVELDQRLYAGVSLAYLEGDWRDYNWLNVRIYRGDPEPLSLTLRIHDRQHEIGSVRFAYSDRFSRSYQLEQGWNLIRIPLTEVESAPNGRPMDMGDIVNLAMFAISLDRPRNVLIDDLRLSRQ